MTIFKVYKITNTLNGKIYVGQTKQSIEKRFMQHLHADSPLGQAMRECGVENFTIEIIEECETQEQLNEREKFWIKVLNCKVPNGYNIFDGFGSSHRCVADITKIGIICERILNSREILGLSQDELAKKLGYKSRSSINKIEKGENDIPISKVIAFAEALNTTPEYLMGWNDRASITNSEETELLNGFNSLTADGKNTLMTMLKSLRVTHSVAV